MSPEELAAMKQTNRGRDYAIIGELPRIMNSVSDMFLYSRSARDLLTLAEQYPDLLKVNENLRPILRLIKKGKEELEIALDAERREMIKLNEQRLLRYTSAAQNWSKLWHDTEKQMNDCSLHEAHKMMSSRALGVLSFDPNQE